MTPERHAEPEEPLTCECGNSLFVACHRMSTRYVGAQMEQYLAVVQCAQCHTIYQQQIGPDGNGAWVVVWRTEKRERRRDE